MNDQNLSPFKPGVSGNPSGRPKGSKNITTFLHELLQKKMDGPETPLTPKGGKMTAAQVVALKLLGRAIRGDLTAIQQLQDRTEGRAKETVEQTVKGEVTIKKRLLDS